MYFLLNAVYYEFALCVLAVTQTHNRALSLSLSLTCYGFHVHSICEAQQLGAHTSIYVRINFRDECARAERHTAATSILNTKKC